MRKLRIVALMVLLGAFSTGAAAEKEGTSFRNMTSTDKIVKKFMQLDVDENESISFEEYMVMISERSTERFSQMDGDNDGEVTSEEYRAFWKERMAKYYRLKK